tara:strand:- start:704 stop:1150 length:447 start_codon:yes stop_codon:yes gene_type:complete
MTDAPELKPCPFCGGDASASPDSEHSTAFVLTHYSKGCPIDDLWDWYPDEEQAITAWNTRADLAKPRVKPLVWEDGKFWSGSVRETAESVFGTYEVLRWVQGDFGGSIPANDPDDTNTEFGGASSLDDAKAAAQADYEARVLACLEGE